MEMGPHLCTQTINAQIMALYKSLEHLSCLAIQLSFDELHSQTSALDILSVVGSSFDSLRQGKISLDFLSGLFWFFLCSPIWGACKGISLAELGRLGWGFHWPENCSRKSIEHDHLLSHLTSYLRFQFLSPWVTQLYQLRSLIPSHWLYSSPLEH